MHYNNKNKQIIEILSIPISQRNYIKTLAFIKKAITKNKKAYICVSAVHLIMEAQKNKKLILGLQKANLVTSDGMPLVWLSKLYGNKNASRVYGPNLTLMMCRLAEKFSYNIFILGGARGQSKLLVQKLKTIFPKLKIIGNIDTPIRPIPKEKNRQIINKINSSKADIVFVGTGCPNQELWMIENRDKVSAPILIGVGAAFDFITKKVKQAPPWMQNNGLEWFYRLLQDPKRLWRRYTVVNIWFVANITKQIIKDLFVKKLDTR